MLPFPYTTSVRKVLDNNQRSPLRPLHKRVVSWFVSYMDRLNTTVPNPLYTHRALVYQHHKNGPKHHCGSLDFPPIRDHFLANPAVRQAEGVAPVAGSDGCHHRSEQTKGALQLGRCEILIAIPDAADASPRRRCPGGGKWPPFMTPRRKNQYFRPNLFVPQQLTPKAYQIHGKPVPGTPWWREIRIAQYFPNGGSTSLVSELI